MSARFTCGAAAPGLAAPESAAQKSESPVAAGLIAEQGKDSSLHSDSARGAEQADRGDIADKLRATLAARLALAGFALYDLAGGAFLVVAAGAASHCCPDLRSVAALLRQIGGGA